MGLLKPFVAPGAATYFFTATATEEDKKVIILLFTFLFMQIQVACSTLNVKDELLMNICKYRGRAKIYLI